MPKLSQNEWYIRRATKDISTILNLPENVVRSVIEALSLHMLDELREKGIHDGDTPTKSSLELPNIGTLELFPMKYPENENSILQGRAFRPKFVIKEQFLLQLRQAYYAGHNFLLDTTTQNFKGMFDDHYSSLIFREEEDDPNE